MSERQTPAPGAPSVPAPSPEQKRITLESYNRAKEAIASGNFDYAVDLLRTCCKIDPANFLYRQTLRKTQKEKYGNNLRGSRFAFFTTPKWKAKVKSAKRAGEYLKVLEHGEEVFIRNPWDLGTQMDVAEAFDALGLTDLAVYTLDQARQKYPKDSTLNRALARLFEKKGEFKKAMALWSLVRELNPQDVEAAHKAKDLAASETIARGQYEAGAAGTKESPAVRAAQAKGTAEHRLLKDAEPLQKRIEADPTEPSLYSQLAAVYRKGGQEDRARAVLQQGLGPTGNHFQLQLELMELDLNPVRKTLAAAEDKIRKLREKAAADDEDDSDEDSHNLEALTKQRAKLAKELNSREIELYRAKADRFPNEQVHRLELGTRLMQAGLYDEAIAEFQQARKDERFKWKAAMHLGLCFRKRNNWRLAQRNFEEALAAAPPNEDGARKELLFQLATGSAETGELQKAIDLGHELANLDYGFKGIGKLLEEWEDRVQNA